MPTPGGYPHLKKTPSYGVNVAVAAGQLVEPDGTTQKVKPATAGSAKVLGYAVTAATPEGSTPTLTFIQQPSVVAVERGHETNVTYAADTTFGASLKAAANGQVTPWVSGTDAANLIVGQCTEPAGVLAAGVGLAFIK